MRQLLSSAGWSLASLVSMVLFTVMLYATSFEVVTYLRGSEQLVRQPIKQVVSQGEDAPPGTKPNSSSVHIPRVSAPFADAPQSAWIKLPAEDPSLPSAAIELQDMPLAQSQNGDGLRIVVPESADDEPFSIDPETRRRELGFDEPAAPPKAPTPTIVLPVATGSLATDAALDEVERTKVKELRETLKKVVEEKAAKMSAKALEAEIQLHQRHLSDLNALEELLRLEQGLKELGDKFPDSDSGVKAKELLKALEHLRTPGGILQPLRKRTNDDLDSFGPKGRTEIRRSRLSPFAYDQMSFKWLRGIVDYDADTGQWIIFYNNRPATADPYRGRLRLHAHDGFSKVKPGDVVLLEGNLDSLARDSQGKPVYKVHYVTQLKPKR